MVSAIMPREVVFSRAYDVWKDTRITLMNQK